jgi:hypothetical protein
MSIIALIVTLLHQWPIIASNSFWAALFCLCLIDIAWILLILISRKINRKVIEG